MTASQAQKTYHVQYLLGFEQPDFLRNAFQVILGRDPDPRSHSFFDERLSRGVMTPVEVLGHIRESPEGRERGVKIRGLRPRSLLARILRRVPWLGSMVVSALFSGGQYTERDLNADIASRSTGAGRSEVLQRRPVLQPAEVASLGFPGFDELPKNAPARIAPPLTALSRKGKPGFAKKREGTRLATLCTRSYLPFARALVNSIHQQHPDIPVVLLVVDLDDGDETPIEDRGGHVTIVSGRELDVPKFDYMALKYSAIDLCCALKPYLVNHVIRTTNTARILFMDADIYVFAPLTEMLDRLESSNFVVIPHTVKPIPHPDRFWEKPTLGDLFNAGVLNAGMFGLTVNDESAAFIDTWEDLVSAPGAFWVSGQMEQHSFNWVTSFAPRVHVLRNLAYNVAYWNLHDRSLRSLKLDDEGGHESWTIDGKPLVAFHFSGFSLNRPSSLSFHDLRHSIYLLPSVANLLRYYSERLIENGADDSWDTDYVFNQFPSGIPIDKEMRDIFKEFEVELFNDVSPWTSQGERFYARAVLSPMPQSGSLIPILFRRLYDSRQDLQTLFPGAHVEPQPFLRWISNHGIYEVGCEELFDRHRPCSPTREGAHSILSAKEELPTAFAGLDCPAGSDRQILISNLEEAGASEFSTRLKQLEFEYYHISELSTLRRFLESRLDIRDRFPDYLHDDADALLDWLRSGGAEEHLLPEGVVTAFARTCQGRALSRVFSFVNAQWELARYWPLAFVGRNSDDLVRFLLTELRCGRQYDLEDIQMFRWTMAERPWTGVGLTMELLPNLAGDPSTLYPEGQERVLAPVLGTSPKFKTELDSYRRTHGPNLRGANLSDNPDRIGSNRIDLVARRGASKERTVFQLIDRLGADSVRQTVMKRQHAGFLAGNRKQVPRRETTGVNLFGYFKSPIGLGMMTRGLARAFELRAVPVAENLMGNVAMSSDLQLTDWLGKFDFSFSSNIFVTYPHDHELLLNRLPDEMTKGRQNIAYLAWEQRDGNPYWRDVYEGFDQIWALSEFAADTFQRALGRDVTAVPCAVDFGAFPPSASKEECGLDPDRYTFLYVFGANSSIERKNPEAAIRAFALAFAPEDKVTLLIKASNAHRLENRRRLNTLVESVAGSGLDVRFLFSDLPYSGVLSLISASDCYVSLHRAEGFSYTCAEAMAYAKPVIATNYSGNLQFMDRGNSYLVDFEEIEVTVPEGPFQRGSVWAEADVKQAAAFMREVYSDIEAARVIGKRASRDVRRQLSHKAIAEIAYGAFMKGAR